MVLDFRWDLSLGGSKIIDGFKIHWTRQDGSEFVADYIFDGCGNQAGYDKVGWALRCLESGRQAGFKWGRILKDEDN